LKWEVLDGLFFDSVWVYNRNGEWIVPTAKTILVPNDTYTDIIGYNFLSSIATHTGGGNSEQTYTLTFNLNGGTWDDGSTTGSISGVSGETIYGIRSPIKSGDTFTGWVLTGGGSYSAEHNDYTFGNADGTLTATWESGEGDNSGGTGGSGDGDNSGGTGDSGDGDNSGGTGDSDPTGEGAITPELSEAGAGIYINSEGNPLYFLVGSKGEDNDNYIALGDKTNGLDIKTK
jgi:hypothetical protein